MSDAARNQLELEDIATRILHQIEQTRLFAEEQHRIRAAARLADREADKVADERLKLAAETAKLQRDHGLAPWLVAFGVTGGALIAAQAVLSLLRSLGHG